MVQGVVGSNPIIHPFFFARSEGVGEDEPELIDPTAQLSEAYLSFIDEFLAAGEQSHKEDRAQIEQLGGFAAYVRRLGEEAKGIDIPEGDVPGNTYWLVGGDEVLGTIRLRHALNAQLENDGGHIGYDVRPSQRGKGYATLMLKLVLVRARGVGLKRVLVTCNKDNDASARVIENNGGVWEDDRISQEFGKPVSRYWIDLGDEAHGS